MVCTQGNIQGIHNLKRFLACKGGRMSHSLAKTTKIACSREHGPNAHLAEKIRVLQTCTAFWPRTIIRVIDWAEILETN